MARTKSYMARHRPICAVLQELRDRLENLTDDHSITLVDEAILYAKRMDAKLVEIRNKENEDVEGR